MFLLDSILLCAGSGPVKSVVLGFSLDDASASNDPDEPMDGSTNFETNKG
jgi:hypothetical protein